MEIPGEEITRTTLSGEYISDVYNASYYVLDNRALEQLVKEEFGIDFDREDRYDIQKVKRDKAAAEARAAAERAARAAAEAEMETAAMGGWDPAPYLELQQQQARLKQTVETGGDAMEIYGAIIDLKEAVMGLE